MKEKRGSKRGPEGVQKGLQRGVQMGGGGGGGPRSGEERRLLSRTAAGNGAYPSFAGFSYGDSCTVLTLDWKDTQQELDIYETNGHFYCCQCRVNKLKQQFFFFQKCFCLIIPFIQSRDFYIKIS